MQSGAVLTSFSVSTPPLVTPPPNPTDHNPIPAWLSRTRVISLAVLLAGIVLLIWGIWRTRDSVDDMRQAIAARHNNKGNQLIDLSPLQTAQRLATQASLPDEMQYATTALRLSDHEVDQAFATALRDAANNAPPGKQLQKVQQQITALYSRIKEDDDRIAALNQQMAKAKHPDDVQQDEDLAKAQLALDQDDLQDEQQVLSLAGNDRHSQLEQALKQQQTSEQKQPLPAATFAGVNTLHDRYNFWRELRNRRTDVQAAQQEAGAAADRLLAERNQRESSLLVREATAKAGGQTATSPTTAPATLPAPSAPDPAAPAPTDQAAKPLTRAEAIAQLRALAIERQTLTEYDLRVTDLRALASNYDKWQALLFGRQRVELHYILRGLVLVLFILIIAIVLDAGIRHYFDNLPVERNRLRNLRVLLVALVQTIGFFVVLMVVFGRPSQLYTFLGLIGAGLTVALKDFILGFVGWFFLMGNHGLRVGDWVEIDGVSGEVIELGLLRTVLFETGNWADAGHPTGRRVAFFNTFAISGHYFNFTTNGQWLWDEIRIPLPAGSDPYRQLAEIERVVVEATAGPAKVAELEWRGITSRYGVQHFSATATTQLRPTAGGMEVVARYITRAHSRTADRERIYSLVLEALRLPAATTPAADATAAATVRS